MCMLLIRWLQNKAILESPIFDHKEDFNIPLSVINSISRQKYQ